MSTGAASAWLASSARRWGVRAPPSVLDLLDAALPFGLTDARYRSELTADGSPLEVSFAADAGASLRFDFEPYEPSTPVEVKRQRAIEWMAQAWPMSGTGTGALQPWLAALEADRFGSARRFGAYRALALDARGTAQTKIYADWNGALPAVLPDRLRTCAEALGVHAATLRPHFASWSQGRGGGAARLYFQGLDELPWTALRGLFSAAALLSRLPHIAHRLMPLLDNTGLLPRGGWVLSIAQAGNDVEIKCELLLKGLCGATPARVAHWLAAQRPNEALAAYWRAVGDGTDLADRVHVVGLRATQAAPPSLSVYLAPRSGPVPAPALAPAPPPVLPGLLISQAA